MKLVYIGINLDTCDLQSEDFLRYKYYKILNIPKKTVIFKLIDKISAKLKRSALKKTYASQDSYSRTPMQIKRSLLPVSLFEEIYRQQHGTEAFITGLLKHEFDLLGSGPVRVSYGTKAAGFENHRYHYSAENSLHENLHLNLNEANRQSSAKIRFLMDSGYIPIDWQLDFKSGYRWSERTYYKDIKAASGRGYDIKVPWELGRNQDLVFLAFCALRLPEYKNRIFFEFRNRILDFIAANPPGWGVQWSCTMDVSIRAANLLTAFDIVRQAGYVPDHDFLTVFENSIKSHFDHIRNNPEWSSGMRGNHYLAGVAGALIICLYTKSSTKDENLQFFANQLVNEIAYQFLPDGGNFEASTDYHLFATDMILWPLLMLKHYDHDEFNEKTAPIKVLLEKIERFSSALWKNERSYPHIGDNDSGYFIMSLITDNHLIINKLRVLFANLLSIEANKNNINMQSYQQFPHFGYYMWKSADDLNRLDIRAGSTGQKGKGGHAHNDQLSFELMLNGINLLIDPGNYCYLPSPEMRNLFRSTAYHNTLIFPDIEQNVFYRNSDDDLFWLDKDRAHATQQSYDEVTKKAAFVHYGYKKPHYRTFGFDTESGTLMLNDKCECQGIRKLHFHFHPDVNKISVKGKASAVISAGGKDFIIECDYGSMELEKYWFAPAYGRKVIAERLVLVTDKREINTLIRQDTP